MKRFWNKSIQVHALNRLVASAALMRPPLCCSSASKRVVWPPPSLACQAVAARRVRALLYCCPSRGQEKWLQIASPMIARGPRPCIEASSHSCERLCGARANRRLPLACSIFSKSTDRWVDSVFSIWTNSILFPICVAKLLRRRPIGLYLRRCSAMNRTCSRYSMTAITLFGFGMESSHE